MNLVIRQFAIALLLLASLPSWAGRSFNGSSTNIVVSGVGNAIDLTGTQMSASCWIYLTVSPAGEVECMNKWANSGLGGFMINFNPSQSVGDFGAFIYISISLNHLHDLFCTPVAALNTWHNIVFTYQNNNSMKMWLDGVKCATDVGVGSTGVLVSSAGSLSFGGLRSGLGCCLVTGTIAEAAVWNVMLSEAEAGSLYKVCPLAVRPSSIVGYWPLYGASGASIEPDLSGNVQSGTLTGTASANHPPCSPRNSVKTLAPLFAAGGGGGGGGGGAPVCGPPSYACSRIDIIPQPYPVSIPCPGPVCTSGTAFLGANFSFTPSDFATTIVRITDRNTGGQAGGTNATAGYLTDAASSEVNLFNIPKTRFSIIQQGNFAQLWALDLIPSIPQATRSTAFRSPGSGGLTFSFTQSYMAYHSVVCGVGVAGCANHDLGFFSYDTTCAGGIVNCNPTPTLLVDVGVACGIVALQGNASANWQDQVTVSGDDQNFSAAASSGGNQGSPGDIYVISWNRTAGCSYWNSNTGQVFLNGALLGTIGIADRFYLHNVRQFKGGTVKVVMQPGTCQTSCPFSATGVYFWTPGTTNVGVVSGTNACGHQAGGYTHWVNQCSGMADANGMIIGPLASPSVHTSLPNAYPSPDEANSSHLTWANDNSADTMPFFATMNWTSFTPTYAWDNEILGVATDGSGKVWRFLHTFATTAILSISVPAAISQDGALLLWTTDWNKGLGNVDGVTLGCSTTADCRLDVMMAILR